MNPPHVKFLCGAPLPASLDWRDEGLLNTFSSALQRYLHHAQSGPASTPGPTQPVARWRAIPLATNKTFHESPVLRKAPLHTTIGVLPKRVGNLRLGPAEDDDHDFLDHSFAFHADLQSSQIAPQDKTGLDDDVNETDQTIDSTFEEDHSTTFMSTELSIREDSQPQPQEIQRLTGPITSVKAIPKAEYLEHLQPQTMTVNMVVGIISIAPARTVTIRKGGYDMDIIELVVGDETQAGFTISSWHPAQDARNRDTDHARRILQALRPQDVILIERVALSSFRGTVFGQSLNRKTTKNTTTFTVLHGLHGMRADSAQQSNLPPAIENKLERVQDWVSSFVGPSAKRKAQSEPLPRNEQRKGKKRALVEEYLPADSQPWSVS